MRNLLSEEIERYQRLSFYNPKLTLTENTDIISEAGFNPATTAREVESAVGRDLQAIIKQYKIGGMSVGEITRLLEKDAKSFEKELQKAFTKDIEAGFPKGELGPAAKNLSKVDMLRRLSVESKSQGRALTPSEIEALIKEVAAENKLKASKFNPKKPPIKETEPTPNEDDAWKKITDPNKNKWNWKKMLKWGAVAGVSAGALYYIYKKTHGEAPPPIVPPVPVPPVPVPPVPPRPSQYRSCPETFPIAQFCKNETVRKVQGCLGVTADGKFGPKTKTALEGKGVSGTSITQDTVNKVCGNTAQVNPDIEDVDGQDPNTI
jgi:hypothetical protein